MPRFAASSQMFAVAGHRTSPHGATIVPLELRVLLHCVEPVVLLSPGILRWAVLASAYWIQPYRRILVSYNGGVFAMKSHFRAILFDPRTGFSDTASHATCDKPQISASFAQPHVVTSPVGPIQPSSPIRTPPLRRTTSWSRVGQNVLAHPLPAFSDLRLSERKTLPSVSARSRLGLAVRTARNWPIRMASNEVPCVRTTVPVWHGGHRPGARLCLDLSWHSSDLFSFSPSARVPSSSGLPAKACWGPA